MSVKEKSVAPLSRRTFLRHLGLAAILAGLGAIILRLGGRVSRGTRWQLDPDRCIQCGRCATLCVLGPSAVKCVHAYKVCGYCDLCGGYHAPGIRKADDAAEHQLCPTGAIRRTFIEDPYYEYTIDESLCIGCGRCVKGCQSFGNGSLFLQVRHDRCVNCNECAIARGCPAEAFRKVPAAIPYLLKGSTV